MVGYEMLAQSQRDLTAEQVIDPKFIHTTGQVQNKVAQQKKTAYCVAS